MAKRSIPLNEILDTPRERPFDYDSDWCSFRMCDEPADPWFGGLAICERHGSLVLARGKRRRNASKPRPRRTTSNRHGVPSRGGDPNPCVYPNCMRGARKDETYLCEMHSSIVASIVRRRAEAAVLLRTHQAAEEDPPKKARPENGSIYFLRVGSYIKIGWTSDLEKRMRAYPPDSILLATQPGTRADEQQLHKRFAGHRSHGREWYPLVPVLMDHINGVVKAHGSPSSVDFGAKPVQVPQPRQKQYIGGPNRGNGTPRVVRG